MAVVVDGPAVSGPALLLALADFTVMTADSYAFVNGPDLGPGYFEFDQLLRLKHRVEHFGLELAGALAHPVRGGGAGARCPGRVPRVAG